MAELEPVTREEAFADEFTRLSSADLDKVEEYVLLGGVVGPIKDRLLHLISELRSLRLEAFATHRRNNQGLWDHCTHCLVNWPCNRMAQYNLE